MREGNHKDVPSARNAKPFRSFVCLFVRSFALRASAINRCGVPAFFRERMVKKLHVKCNNCLRTHPLFCIGAFKRVKMVPQKNFALDVGLGREERQA